jgi:hypothetical protein
MNVSARSYVCPTLVLLAFDWPGGGTHERLVLAPDGSWAKMYFVADSPEDKARLRLRFRTAAIEPRSGERQSAEARVSESAEDASTPRAR